MTANASTGQEKDIRIASSILKRATQDDSDAIATMFKQFISDNETIYYVQYLGLQGMWGIGTREFACLTDRRVADITVGRFGKVTYQDGYLEHINSCFIFQPSKFSLYLIIGFWVLVSLPTFGLLLLLLPFVVQSYYRIYKCGLVLAVRGGIPIYIFTNRKLLTRANALLRLLTISREDRIKLRGVV
ncbi:hypothetical protein F7734_41755 [Scytonema sp. UIC 10036]|nr:hypothetical protein [Scytonema sp. UIC 10036]